MKKIKSIVEDLDIKNSKEILENNKLNIFYNEREMAKLTFNRNVGVYAFNLDEYLYTMALLDKEKDDSKKLELKEKMDDLYFKLIDMESNKNIRRYKNLRKEIKTLKDECKEYYKLINDDLREALSSFKMPGIYVFQGYLDDEKRFVYGRNIIANNVVGAYDNDIDNIIYPEYDLTSNRDLRHFYNKVSFKYLEGITEDYSYDLNGKKLGRIKIGR